MSTRNIFYDIAFLEDGETIDLISIGMVCDDGTEYYAVNADCDFERICLHEWLWDNVVPSLPTTVTEQQSLAASFSSLTAILGGATWEQRNTALDKTSPLVKPKWVIANEVREFITRHYDVGDTPRLWAYFSAFDHVALAWLYGPMSELPDGIPMWTNDIRQLLDELPKSAWDKIAPQKGTEHDALEDARHNLYMFNYATEFLALDQVK